MSEARSHILSRIRNNIQSDQTDAQRRDMAMNRIASLPKGILPHHANCDGADRLALFKERLEKVHGVFHKLDALGDVPETVRDILAKSNEPSIVTLPETGPLRDIDWEKSPTLEVIYGAADEKCQVAVSFAHYAIAETATLMLLSGPSGPTTLNFLPSTHLVVVKEGDLVRHYEEAFDRIRAMWDKDKEAQLPRCINLVTGPSRTGDVEHRLILGAHGPLNLHVLVVP